MVFSGTSPEGGQFGKGFRLKADDVDRRFYDFRRGELHKSISAEFKRRYSLQLFAVAM
jgi:hypothetical protein